MIIINTLDRVNDKLIFELRFKWFEVLEQIGSNLPVYNCDFHTVYDSRIYLTFVLSEKVSFIAFEVIELTSSAIYTIIMGFSVVTEVYG